MGLKFRSKSQKIQGQKLFETEKDSSASMFKWSVDQTVEYMILMLLDLEVLMIPLYGLHLHYFSGSDQVPLGNIIS